MDRSSSERGDVVGAVAAGGAMIAVKAIYRPLVFENRFLLYYVVLNIHSCLSNCLLSVFTISHNCNASAVFYITVLHVVSLWLRRLSLLATSLLLISRFIAMVTIFTRLRKADMKIRGKKKSFKKTQIDCVMDLFIGYFCLLSFLIAAHGNRDVLLPVTYIFYNHSIIPQYFIFYLYLSQPTIPLLLLLSDP
jgi:hypothetical protein